MRLRTVREWLGVIAFAITCCVDLTGCAPRRQELYYDMNCVYGDSISVYYNGRAYVWVRSEIDSMTGEYALRRIREACSEDAR